MNRPVSIVTKFAAGSLALGLALVIGNGSAFAKGGKPKSIPTPAPTTLKLFAVGNGSGLDDKTTGSCDTTTFPDLACLPGDFCGCLSGTATDFGCEGIGHAALTELEISFDFDNPTGPNGIPNGTVADSTPPPLSGRCYGASGLAQVTVPDTASDTVSLLLQGIVCDAIPGQSANFASFTGSYIINGGTGPFNGATGTGSFTASIDNVNTAPALSPMTFSATGSITQLVPWNDISEWSPTCGGGDSRDGGDGGDSDSNGDAHSGSHNGHWKG
jgi:hypothetical protein